MAIPMSELFACTILIGKLVPRPTQFASGLPSAGQPVHTSSTAGPTRGYLARHLVLQCVDYVFETVATMSHIYQ